MAQAAPSKSSHRWSFYRAGGVDQVRLDTGADILHLDELDLKLWVALSCPVQGLEIEPRTLQLLDADGDAHVRPPEILAAVKWLREVLKNADALAKGEDGVALANLRTDTAEGQAILAAAKRMLAGLGKDAAVVTVADAEQKAAIFAAQQHNGDGIVPPESIGDAAARAVAQDIVACMGGVADRSGKTGYDQAQLDAFFAACADYEAWQAAADADRAKVLPFGDGTAAAYAAFAAVRAKVDDYFGRCRLAAFDPRALAAVNREQEAYIAAAAKDLSITAAEVAHFPLALVEPGKPLPLQQGVNPAWASAIEALRTACLPGKTALTEAEWLALGAKFAAYEAWLGKQAGTAVAGLGRARVREILAGGSKAVLQQAIADDLAVAGEVEAATRVEKLCRLHRDFALLLRNYVSFTDFYARRGAIFQAGTLYLDGRACDLCFHVHDAGKHAKMAPMSNAFLAYVDCTRPGGAKMTVACAFTAGDSDNLFEGRNGIFYDRKGQDWDATITKIFANPISIRQAFWSPYKKVLRGIQEAVAKRAAEADANASSKLTTEVAAAGETAKTGQAPPKPKFDVGTIAALGVAVSGIAGVITALFMGFLGLGPWIPVGLVGVLLAISGPSMFIAWLKLRTRNLGPILDANGWAVNTLTRVNVPLGGALTELPRIPPGSKRDLTDPYAPKKSPWPRVLFVLALLAAVVWGLYRTNLLHKWLPRWVPAHHTEVDLDTVDGKTTAVQGESIVFVVRNKATALSIVDAATGNALTSLAVGPDGRATLATTSDTAPGTYVVSDGNTKLRIRVAKKP